MTLKKVSIDGHSIEISNGEKVLFPQKGITKGDIVEYYRRIAPTALRYYAGRPLSMQRFPDGIGGEGFFQKEIPDYFPAWIARAKMSKEDGTVTHVLANNAATLVYLANQACITPHLALSKHGNAQKPDRMLFDLDPSDNDFSKVQDVAAQLKNCLERHEMPAFVQTTGSRGLHIVVPLDGESDFDDVRAFARGVAEKIAGNRPALATAEQRKNKRGGRVFIDYLRNAYGQTSVAPYAVRAREGAPLATPLRWDEALSSGMTPGKYSIANIFRRLAQTEDPWKDIDEAPTALKAILA